jgi:septum formation protein
MLSGNRHEFFTGVQMIDIKTAQQLERVAWTSITLRSLSDEEIEQYLENGDYKKLALGYNVISGFSSTFVRRIEGSLTSLAHGVPLDDVIEMLSSLSKT